MATNYVLIPKINQLCLNTAKYVSLLESYTKARSLADIIHLHAHIITSGILSFKPFILRANLASSYAQCGHVSHARKLFDDLPKPTLFLYNAMIMMYSKNGEPCKVLRLFVKMLSSGKVFADSFTYPFVVKACGELGMVRIGGVVHGKAVTGGFGTKLFLMNSLVAMYMNCGEVGIARRVFDVMSERDVVSWASMISGYVRNGCASDALLVFDEMVGMGVEVNRYAVLSVLSACGQLEDFGFGRKVHAVVKERRLQNDVSICNALIDMYAKCGSMDEAQEVFDRMEEKDVVTWTSLISGYISNEHARRAFGLCRLMQLEGVMPNIVTIVMLLQACGILTSLEEGKCLHAWVIRRDIFCDTIIETALIVMYAKCGSSSLSCRVLTHNLVKKVAPWNAYIAGYMLNGLAREAVFCFKQMLHEGLHPDAITFSSVLPAYAKFADGRQACNIHSYLIHSGFLRGNEVVRGLIDLYAQCGNLEYSRKIFSEVSRDCRDITLWSALIAGYGAHGDGEAAISLFKQMVQCGLKPNEVTFTCVLDACSHAGLVDEGLDLFKQRLKERETNPCMHHYTCMIDLLGRAGRLQEAYDLILAMPFKPNHAVWGALLGACVVHKNVELGEISARSLFDLEPENTGNYVLLANIYSASGRWQDAESMRSMINDVWSRKTPGHSSVEVRSF